jgi:hypothetical protein
LCSFKSVNQSSITPSTRHPINQSVFLFQFTKSSIHSFIHSFIH